MAWSPARPEPARRSRCRSWPRALPRAACRCSWPTSRATSPGSPGRRGQPEARRARRHGRPRRLRAARLSDGVLGPVRRAGPSDPDHGVRDGAAAAGAAARPERDPGGRPQHRLQGRRRAGPAAARSQGSARPDELRRRARQRPVAAVRPGQHRLGRRDPAPPADPRAAGRRPLLRRAGARHQGSDAHRPRRPGHDQPARRRSADDGAPALRHLPALAAVRAVRGAARGRRPGQAEAGVLLRRGAPSVQRRAAARCSTRSSRWCG